MERTVERPIIADTSALVSLATKTDHNHVPATKAAVELREAQRPIILPSDVLVETVNTLGIQTAIGCHTFRATGITIYLLNGGSLEKAQRMAAHESPRTTKLYDRTSDEVSLDEVERVVF